MKGYSKKKLGQSSAGYEMLFFALRSSAIADVVTSPSNHKVWHFSLGRTLTGKVNKAREVKEAWATLLTAIVEGETRDACVASAAAKAAYNQQLE